MKTKPQTPWSRDVWRYRFIIPSNDQMRADPRCRPICSKVFDHKVELDNPVPYRVWPDRCECMARVQPCRHRLMVETIQKYFCCPIHGIAEAALDEQFQIRSRMSGILFPHICCLKCRAESTQKMAPVSYGTWCEWWLGRTLELSEFKLCTEILTGQTYAGQAIYEDL